LRLSVGSRSSGGVSYQSISPRSSAATAVAASGMITRHVVGVLGVDVLRILHQLVGHELERAGADVVGDRRAWIDVGVLLAEDVQRLGAHLRHRVQNRTPGLLEGEREGTVVDHLQVHAVLDHDQAVGVLRSPALDRGDRVLGCHRRAVVELEPGAEAEGVDQPVGGERVALDHLRLWPLVLVHAVQRVVDHVGVLMGHRRLVDRIVVDRKLRLRGVAEHGLRLRRQGEQRGGCDARE
jgi:hypothetical protein